MKYYLGKVGERNGDLEYSDVYLFKTEGDPEEFGEMTAMEWRGSTWDDFDEEHNAWWCDHTLIYNEGCREIPEEDFIVLNKYIPAMPTPLILQEK